MAPVTTRRRGGRPGIAFAVSIAAHGLVLAALVRLGHERPAPPGAMVVTLEARTRAPAAVPAPAAAAPRPAPARPPPASGRAGTPAGAGDGAQASADALTPWVGGGASGGAGPHDLAPRLPGPAPAWFGAPEPTRQQVLGTRIADMLETLRAEDLSRYPDASWTDLRDALGAGFLAPGSALDRARVTDGSSGGPNALGRYAQALNAASERYGKTGSPMPKGTGTPGEHDNPRTVERIVAAAGALGSPERSALAAAIDGLDAQVGPQAPTESLGGLVAIVAVKLDAAGAVERARLVARSGSADYDASALEAAGRLVGRALSRRLAGTETEWAFVTEVRLRPMTAAAAVQFDATFKPTGVSHPLQRVVRTRVELRAIRRG